MDKKRRKLCLERVIAKLEQVKEERARDKINFETEKCELESKIDKYKGQCTELQSENEKLQSEKEKLQSENENVQSENEKLQSENKRLQKYLQDLESSNKNVEEKSQINLYNTDLTSQITKVIAKLEKVKEERARDKINFETEKCELESKIDKYKGQCTELQSENEKLQSEKEKLQSENENVQSENEKLQSENKRLQKYLQDLESSNKNVEEKSQINLYNTDLTSQITKVNESNDDALNINSLPNEIIVKVFGYLKQNQLGQIARLCRRWNVLTKSPVLWKKVNVEFSPSHKCQTTVAESFINTLPSCVTSIRLHFTNYICWIESLNFEQLCPRLQEKCHLEELILIHSDLSSSLFSVISLCTQFLQDVKNLIFHYSNFRFHRGTFECFGISKIEILDLFNCYFDYSSIFKSPFSKMLHLKQLHLFDTIVPNSWFEDDASFVNQLHVLNLGRTRITAETFQAIQNHGLNLKEFYVCVNWLEDHKITLNNSAFPHLKIICLAHTWVTYEGVVSLIQSCPSLENVYVDEAVAVSFAAHPFLAANRCKSEIVKAIGRDHIHNLDYFCI